MSEQAKDTVHQYRQRKLERLKGVRTDDDVQRYIVRRAIRLLEKQMQGQNNDGGPGSGNWGHAGRPGAVGGSGKGGGAHNRQGTKESGYTSFSKKKKAAAQPHKATTKELRELPQGSIVKIKDGSYAGKWEKKDGSGSGGFINVANGEYINAMGIAHEVSEVSIAIPDSASPNYLKLHESEFDISQERMDNAPRYESRQYIDHLLRSDSGKVWRSLSDVERYALYAYTGSDYDSINGQLRKGKDNGCEESIEAITKAINKSSLPDIWLQRGISTESAARFLKVDQSVIDNALDNDGGIADLIGRRGYDEAFMSCGSTENTGMGFQNVQLHIFCPKGTKGIYTEPFSAFGLGMPFEWDGVSTQQKFSSEFETILQRGTSVEVLNAYRESGTVNNTLHVECRVTGQDNAK